jgi:hypothetical protein
MYEKMVRWINLRAITKNVVKKNRTKQTNSHVIQYIQMALPNNHVFSVSQIVKIGEKFRTFI